MTGAPVWDALIWAVIGLVAGFALARASTPRAPLFLALGVALAGFLLVPLMFMIFGEAGAGYAMMVVLWSVPTTLGLALGAGASRLGRRD
ncbi:MAG: hypothetical protein KDK01_07580 [Rhodobacteraceae bacterium]|jgi:hypothetical protein|nr:hypothetical protein [Paracoccaceae bacterium]